MPWSTRGQYCAYCKSYLNSGNLSRHLETCARFDGRFSVDRAKDALELEQKHKAKYTTKYVLSRSEVYEIIGEFVGHTLTNSMGQEMLEKAGHRLIGSAGELDPTDITSLQETDLEVYSREGKLLHDDVDGTFTDGERSSRAGGKGKRLLQTTTEEENAIGAKVRKFKVDPNQKPSIVNGNSSVEDTSTHDQYAPLFPSMKLIVDGYAFLNENLGDLSLFQRPSDKDFRDVTAFIMCMLLHEKTHMPRLCQKMTLSDVLNPRITSSGAREIVVHKISPGGAEEVISIGKELHDFLLKYNVAMRGQMEGDEDPCNSNFFRNTKGKSFDYGIGKDIARFKDKYDINIGLKRDELSTARQKKEQFMLVDKFVCNELTVKYPFVSETPTLKDIEKEINIMTTTEWDSVRKKEYSSWLNLANYTNISKCILDRWIYCNQEAIGRRALAMYRERPGDAEIKRLTEEYNLYKLSQTKMASLWKPPMGRMKRQTSTTSTGKMPKHKLADAEVCQKVCQSNSAQNDLLQHIENQDWPNLIIGQVADRGRVVRATKIIEKGIYVCNFDGVVLEPDACKAFLENAEVHSDNPSLGRTEYCMIFKFDGRKYGKPCGKWMINANDEPEEVGLKISFGRLISHCRRHPNLKLVHLTIKGNPYVLLETTKKILPGEELMYDYGDRSCGLEDFMKHKNCICFKCCS